MSADPNHGPHYNPNRAEALRDVSRLCAQLRSVIDARKPGKCRVRGIAWRLLQLHTEYCEKLAAVMLEKCLGHDRLALDLYKAFLESFGKHDYETERYLDLNLAAYSHNAVVKRMPAIEQ